MAIGAFPFDRVELTAQEASVAMLREMSAHQTNSGVVDSLKMASRPRRIQRFDKSAGGIGAARVRDGIIYAVKLSREIHAIRISDGKTLWKFKTASTVNGIEFWSEGELEFLIALTGTGARGLMRKTGRLVWSRQVMHGLADGIVVGESLYVAGRDGKVYCIDVGGGNIVWSHDYLMDAPEDPKGFDGNQARFANQKSRPRGASTDGQTMFFSVFDQCRVIAVDCKSGERKWAFQTKGWVFGRPTVTDKYVFVGSQDKYFYCINKADGTLAWKFKTKSRVEASGAVTDAHVYFGSCDGNLYCVAIETGELKWSFQTPKHEKYGAPIYEQPIISGETVILPAMQGEIYALDLETAQQRWKLRPSNKSQIDGSFTDGERLYVTTRLNFDDQGEDAMYVLGN